MVATNLTCRPEARCAASHPPLITLALVSAALLLASATVLAQGADAASGASDHQANQTAVTVRAHRMLRHKIVGQDYAGIPIEQVTLMREVNYHDLDLHTAKGAAELLHRINFTAREACHQLSSLYPNNVWTTSNADCVRTAIDQAQTQLPESVAQLQREARGTAE